MSGRAALHGVNPRIGRLRGALMAAAVMTAALSAAGPALLDAQDLDGAAVEVRLGGAVGGVQGSGAGLELVPGPAWSVGAAVRVIGRTELFAAFGSARFGCRTAFCQDQDIRFHSTGGEAGARMPLPTATTAAGPWLHLAILAHRLTWEASEDRSASHETAVGAEGGLEWRLPLSPRFSINPAVRAAGYVAEGPGGSSRAVVVGRTEIILRIRPFAG